jgi:hypothetical protein
VSEYVRKTRAFREQYSGIKTFSAWNEPNNRDQPFKRKGGKGPIAAAVYAYYFHRSVCMDCTLIASDMIQNAEEWKPYLRDYVKTTRSRYAARGSPAYPSIWGIHPYRDLNVLQYRSTKARRAGEEPRSGTKFFSRVVGRRSIWFSEIGSRIDTGSGSPRVGRRKRLSQQAADVRYLLGSLARTGGRIRRLYYHSLCEGSGLSDRQFDAALLGGSDPARSGCSATRPAYRAFQSESTKASRAR